MNASSTAIGAKQVKSLSALLERFRAEPNIILLVAAAAAIAVVVALLLWAKAPEYRVLYSNISDQDGGSVVNVLEQMEVPYRFADNSSAIMIPADKVYETRLKLAQQGLPKAGSVGFELLDKEKFGISQFSEQINYQRALEGEMARTIETLGPIESARIHLAIPKPSLFVREQKQPTASVTLNMQSGRSLSEGQISAITYMVSSAVPDLPVDNVTVIDQRGRLLTQPGNDGLSLNATQLKYTSEVEADYERRITSILAPFIGQSNVHAQVTAQLNYASVEQTAEEYQPNSKPESMAIRSRQSSTSEQGGGLLVGGVPGALSNQPTPAATAPIKTDPAADAKTKASPVSPFNNRNDETTNFEVDRKTTHTRQSAGSIQRLSAAVVVNFKSDEEGLPVELTPAEMANITALIREAMGYSEARGDSLNVVNSHFVPDEDANIRLPFWQQPAFFDLLINAARYLVVLLVAWLIWRKALRPMWLKQQQLMRERLIFEESAKKPKAKVAPVSNTERDEALKAELHRTTENDSEHLRGVADQDPRIIALVIRRWINAEKESA